MTEMLYKVALLVHQLTALVMSGKEAEPALFVTFTATSFASGATPSAVLPLATAIPATWVPWPLSSSALSSSLVSSGQQLPAPALQKHFSATIWLRKPGWVVLTPVSMTQTVCPKPVRFCVSFCLAWTTEALIKGRESVSRGFVSITFSISWTLGSAIRLENSLASMSAR